ncbi:Thiamine biosynthesis regulatory protein [Wickerhamomyces ciferrii]|uniref:Thiamine biosynthesis regulatory protein n=1 Tax=Wickerhamomyces ciferrii (strain ATCC 14091 / BCRC 22168 / CBS 111 / JCM 3599 / NBRC 0793 / NRRL Y-1031 F-60-10) TaxID=1206466 RepID=K0KHA1_WICCF|nr:Thiamine biosynthesis regulatory protein [Wickerhamomyces ciferrii]CCH44595.1 Thiamine biosynthesis regulatory protein [Wickerhamomyces ciferrii]
MVLNKKSPVAGRKEEAKVKRTRTRSGCHNCKRSKVKCDEIKPSCTLCQNSRKKCDYSVHLIWGGRPYKKKRDNVYGFATIDTFKKPDTVSLDLKNGKLGKKNDNNYGQITSDFSDNSSSANLIPEVPNNNEILNPITQDSITNGNPLDQIFDHDHIHIENQFDLNPDLSDLQSSCGAINTLNFENSKIFEEMETTNVTAKEFLNDFILPDLNLFTNNYQSSSYLNELNPRIQELEQNHENLIDEESLISRNMFSNISQTSSSNSSLIDYNIASTEKEEDLLTGFEFIPYSFLPLPDMLLKAPYFRENFHIFVEIVSVTIVVAPPVIYENNPIKKILPQMAISSYTDGMLALLVATGIMQSCVYRGEQHPKGIVNMLLKKSLNDLYNRLTDVNEANSDYTLALVMMFACFGSIFSERKDWRAHHNGAKNIILARGLIKTNNEIHNENTQKRKIVTLGRSGDENDIVFFLSRWFAYIDVIGSLSSSLKFSTPIEQDNQLLWEAQDVSEKDILELRDIDQLSGLDLRLLSHLSKILSLIKERECYYKEKDQDLSKNSNEPSIIERALEVKDDLLKCLEIFENERTKVVQQVIIRQDPAKLIKLKEYETMRAVNKALIYAGVLQLYRRVLLISRNSKLVQNMIFDITEILRAKVDRDTHTSFCTIFALITAGCDAIDEDTRFFYADRVYALGQRGFRFGYEAHKVMLESWNTGKFWIDIITERNIDFGFF